MKKPIDVGKKVKSRNVELLDHNSTGYKFFPLTTKTIKSPRDPRI